jgi:tetraprenyl-beta-curcumene synthase
MLVYDGTRPRMTLVASTIEARSVLARDRATVHLSRRQLQALLAAASRELLWGTPNISDEVRRWGKLAAAIPDEAIREDALRCMACKRANIHGAGLFWTLPRERSGSLLNLLVSYQVMWDFLDSANERGAHAGHQNGLQLHLALVDAIDPTRPISDYYRYHPWQDDGGYLRALVEACRARCLDLPSFEKVRHILMQDAMRAGVQAFNHIADPVKREVALRAWVAREYPTNPGVEWFESSAAAGAGIGIYAMFALAAESECSDRAITQIHDVYFPWVSAAATMLDSYVDTAEDLASDHHCYTAYYSSDGDPTQELSRLIRRCLYEASRLENGERHALLASCMIAMYLSKDSALSKEMRACTHALLDAGGPLVKALHPVLRLWRRTFAQQSM